MMIVMEFTVKEELAIPAELQHQPISEHVLTRFGYDPATLTDGMPTVHLELFGERSNGYWIVRAFVLNVPSGKPVKVGEINCGRIARGDVFAIMDSWIHGSEYVEGRTLPTNTAAPYLDFVVGETIFRGEH